MIKKVECYWLTSVPTFSPVTKPCWMNAEPLSSLNESFLRTICVDETLSVNGVLNTMTDSPFERSKANDWGASDTRPPATIDNAITDFANFIMPPCNF